MNDKVDGLAPERSDDERIRELERELATAKRENWCYRKLLLIPSRIFFGKRLSIAIEEFGDEVRNAYDSAKEFDLIETVKGVFIRAPERGLKLIEAYAIWRARRYLLLILTAAAGSVGIFLAWTANKLLSSQNELIQTQNELAEATRRATLVFELTSIMEEISRTAATIDSDKTTETSNPGTLRHLNPLVSARIVTLSRSLRPYRSLDENGVIREKSLSPERAQLLLSLISAEVNLIEIIKNCDFSYADLAGSSIGPITILPEDIALNSLDVSHSDMSGSLLEGVVFTACNFFGADLSDARIYSSFWGADFQDADLRGAIFSYGTLERADFSRADLRYARFENDVGLNLCEWRDANIYGVFFEDSKAREIALKGGAVEVADDHWKRDLSKP
jgi:hypothetical protein